MMMMMMMCLQLNVREQLSLVDHLDNQISIINKGDDPLYKPHNVQYRLLMGASNLHECCRLLCTSSEFHESCTVNRQMTFCIMQTS